MTLSIMTLNITRLSITTLFVMTFSIMMLYTKRCNAKCHYVERCVLLIVRLNVIALSVIAPRATTLSIMTLIITTPEHNSTSAIRLSAVMLSVAIYSLLC